jgi:hypothetical protein
VNYSNFPLLGGSKGGGSAEAAMDSAEMAVEGNRDGDRINPLCLTH